MASSGGVENVYSADEKSRYNKKSNVLWFSLTCFFYIDSIRAVEYTFLTPRVR